MIKLFWNTQNQTKSITNDKKIISNDRLNLSWGLYHKTNSSKWIYEVLKQVKYNIIENEKNIESKDILIIIDSSIEKKVEFYVKLKLLCSKVFLFHLGDEAGTNNFSPVYNNCDFVWRTFCSNKFFINDKVKCIPIGYKSGVVNKEKKIRKFKWSFVGTPHKTSRHDLLFQYSDIEPFFCHKTKEFDKKIISVDEMSEVLSSTEFMPCPNGFVHPETYRLYEALECGSIPIVENTYQYYDRLFPENPFIKINKWSDAKAMIKNWNSNQIAEKRKECEVWWNEYKEKIQVYVKNKIN